MGWGACLDACVLLPAGLRDDLLSVASTRIYRPVWSTQILREVDRHLLGQPYFLSADQVEHLGRELRGAFPGAELSDEECEPFLGAVPEAVHPKDRHVVAAALMGGCGIIVTANLKDFARNELPAMINIEVKSPIEFLVDQWTMNPVLVAAGVRRQLTRLGRTPEQHVEALKGRLPAYGEVVAADIALLRATSGAA